MIENMPKLVDASDQLYLEGILKQPLLCPSAYLVVCFFHTYDENQGFLEIFNVKLEPVDVFQVFMELGW